MRAPQSTGRRANEKRLSVRRTDPSRRCCRHDYEVTFSNLGRAALFMYLTTLVCSISIPSLRSSPWTPVLPKEDWIGNFPRTNLRISGAAFSRPSRHGDFLRQDEMNPARCHLIERSSFKLGCLSYHSECRRPSSP